MKIRKLRENNFTFEFDDYALKLYKLKWYIRNQDLKTLLEELDTNEATDLIVQTLKRCFIKLATLVQKESRGEINGFGQELKEKLYEYLRDDITLNKVWDVLITCEPLKTEVEHFYAAEPDYYAHLNYRPNQIFRPYDNKRILDGDKTASTLKRIQNVRDRFTR